MRASTARPAVSHRAAAAASTAAISTASAASARKAQAAEGAAGAGAGGAASGALAGLGPSPEGGGGGGLMVAGLGGSVQTPGKVPATSVLEQKARKPVMSHSGISRMAAAGRPARRGGWDGAVCVAAWQRERRPSLFLLFGNQKRHCMRSGKAAI